MQVVNTVGDFSVFILLTLVLLRESLKNRHRSCAPLPREESCFAEMSCHYSTGKIYYKARNLIASRTTAHHHKLFAKSYIENNVIPNGWYFKFIPLHVQILVTNSESLADSDSQRHPKIC